MDFKNGQTLQLGARSSEEAARWIRSLMEAALKVLMFLLVLLYSLTTVHVYTFAGRPKQRRKCCISFKKKI